MLSSNFSIIILAAGKAKRFKSDRSKLLHTLAGCPLGDYVVRAAFAAEPESVWMVTGRDGEAVRKTLARPGLKFVEQKRQLGTGHAVRAMRSELQRCPSPLVIIVVGDAPLLRAETLRALVAAHEKARAAATALTLRLDEPQGYGRIVRSSGTRIRAIVEEKLCTFAQRKIREVNSGILCFSRLDLLKHLDELSDENAQKEFLLTDLVAIFNRHRKKVVAFPAADPQEVLGVNDRVELARVEGILRLQKAQALMRDGVTIVDPKATYIDEEVEVGYDTVIEPGVSLLGMTRVGQGCMIRPYSTISNTVLGDRVLIRPCSVISDCQVASDVIIGPFAHLRDGAVIDPGARIGNFVEVKKSHVGSGTKAWHLTYLGDATLGREVNVGAGTVTCNYDGEKKNPTVIEDKVFVGSGSMLVAPLRIGKGAYIAAGSAIIEDVQPGALAIGRARQTNKEGWVEKHTSAKGPDGFDIRQAGTVVVFDVHRTAKAGELVGRLSEIVSLHLRPGKERALLNLAALTRIDAAEAGALAEAAASYRKAGGGLKLVRVPAPVLRVLKASGLDEAVEIHTDERAALESFDESSLT